MADSTPKVKSLHKALQLLDCFLGNERELGITELSDALGQYKSTVHNIVTTYEQSGILEKNPQTGKYRLGLKLLTFSSTMLRHMDLCQAARPFMQAASNHTGERCYLAQRMGNEVIYIGDTLPQNQLAGGSIIGVRAPMYCTSIGKAILAFLPQEHIRQVMDAGYESFTPNTITDDDALEKELARIRTQGYAVDNMEHEYGVKCVGMPLFSRSGVPIAGLSLTGPSLRFTDENIVRFADELRLVIQGTNAQISL